METKSGVWKLITIICVTYVQQDFQIQTLIKQLLTKYQIFTSWEWILYQIIWPCIIVFGYHCTNGSFIWTVPNTSSLHTSTYKYLVNLSISDLLFLIMYYIPRIIDYQKSPLRNSLPSIVNASYYFFFSCSVGSITLVSLERFLAIHCP